LVVWILLLVKTLLRFENTEQNKCEDHEEEDDHVDATLSASSLLTGNLEILPENVRWLGCLNEFAFLSQENERIVPLIVVTKHVSLEEMFFASFKSLLVIESDERAYWCPKFFHVIFYDIIDLCILLWYFVELSSGN